MHYAAEQAGMKLASRNTVTMTADANRRDQGSAAGTGASAVVLIHEQEAAALTACRDPCKDVPNLKVPRAVMVVFCLQQQCSMTDNMPASWKPLAHSATTQLVAECWFGKPAEKL
jgi:hypothetical protein